CAGLRTGAPGMTIFDRPPASARAPHVAAFGLLFYGAALLGVLALGTRVAVHALSAPSRPLTFISLAIAPPTVTVEVPRPVHVDIPPPKLDPLPAPEPPPPPPPEPRPPEPEPTPVIKPPRPAPPKPKVTVGAFDSRPTVTTPATPPKQVQATAFDTPSVAASTTRNQAVAVTGAFESIAGGKPTGPAPGPAVAPGSFDRPASPGTPGAARGQVVSTGFDSGPATQAARSTGAVRAGAFGDAPAAPTDVREGPRPPATSTPVEVTYKPTPGYTDEARARKIQGTVVLDVEFTAAGTVRVLNVVHGLGYGLDEIARQVATAMRFKPATQDGRPVDSRATVEIVFRLT
ncbi:MAG TPA: energy transducer TonB, partial [Vicinamibacterales bacterium]|nr:energy transducer TonB [Vicinamibacterales bacterium]